MGFAETFKALSDGQRREILYLLKDRKLSAGDIAARFPVTGATVSYHLNVLKRAGLVFESREKNFIYYQLNTSVLEDVLLWLTDLRGTSGGDGSDTRDGPESRSSPEDGLNTGDGPDKREGPETGNHTKGAENHEKDRTDGKPA